ncbi:hypothetical protein O1L60_44815 [Streptomyces diastatochromogenes]|nr:hypothetical protein [Streptomyces diastatochromogenes]
MPHERLVPQRIQAHPDDHAEARYLREALEEQAARAADVERRALLRARQERAQPKTTPPTPVRVTGAA